MNAMLIYIFLEILQGILEWIPISSEGIIALISNFLIENVNPIDIALFSHIGTLFVILIYFRKDWKEVLMFKNIENFKIFLLRLKDSIDEIGGDIGWIENKKIILISPNTIIKL